MQRVVLVRYTAKADRAAENEKLSRAVFTELRSELPEGVAYAVFRNGREFVHVFLNFNEDDSSALTELSSFKTFSKDVADRCEAPPEQTRLPLHLIESYGFSTAKVPA